MRDRGRPAGSAIAFGLGPQLDRFRRVGAYDVAFRLQENSWNGTTSPQLVVRRIFETPDRYFELRERFAAEWRSGSLSPEAEEVFGEVGLTTGGSAAWRSLLESQSLSRAARSAAGARPGGLGLRTDEQQLEDADEQLCPFPLDEMASAHGQHPSACVPRFLRNNTRKREVLSVNARSTL